jgi:hypothetical protein
MNTNVSMKERDPWVEFNAILYKMKRLTQGIS